MLTPIKPVKSCECSGSCGDCCCCTKESIGLGNVDNTSDLNKPLSTDMVNALSGKVGLDIFTKLKNRVLALEAKDSNNVKLSGATDQTIQGTLKANDPVTGATDKTLVTANWVSQTGDRGPNNLIHKFGDETKYGKLKLGDVLTLYNENWETAPFTIYKWAFDSMTPPTKFETINGGFEIRDVNNRKIWRLWAYRDTNGRDVLSIDGFAYDNTSGYFHFEIGPNNYRRIATNFDKPSNW